MACNMGEVATVEAWLDSGNHPDDATTFGGTLLVAAAERGGPDMMRMLIARGATVDARDDDEDRRGPLLSAAFEDNVRAMKILIESGANVNAQTSGGYSVLMEAVVSVYHKSIEPEDVLFLLRQAVFKSISSLCSREVVLGLRKLRFDFRTGATAQITPCVTTGVTTPRR